MTLTSKIPAFLAALDDAQRRGLQRTSVQIVEAAQRFVPVDTSALRRTIHSEDTDTPLRILVIAGDPSAINPKSGQGVSYAPHVEYGTSRAAAQPFMTPAAAQARPDREIAIELRAIAARSRV
jgi:HK97 gp10 family phage protein